MSVITSNPLRTRFSSGRIALLITLGTESVFFATVLVAYIALRSQVNWDVPHTLVRLAVPLVNTSILLASALAAWKAHTAIRSGKQESLRRGLFAALVLGVAFVAMQIYEFNHAGLRIDDPAFGGVFFTLIVFHAAHVLAGVFFLALNLLRAQLGDYSAQRHEAVETGTWFWYYVCAVWVVLFTALYLI